MTDPSEREGLLRSDEGDAATDEGHDSWESAPWDAGPDSGMDMPASAPASGKKERDPGKALARAEAALIAARNEITLLRARIERLSEDNDQLTAELREARLRR